MTAGSRPTGSEQKPVTKAHDGTKTCLVCGARLSSYNPGPHCYTHTVGIPWRGPSAPPK